MKSLAAFFLSVTIALPSLGANSAVDMALKESFDLIEEGKTVEGFDSLVQFLKSPANYNVQSCVHVLKTIEKAYFDAPADIFLPTSEKRVNMVKKDAVNVLNKLFELRETIKTGFFSFENANPSKSCVNKVRRGLLYIRYFEEYLAEYLYANGYIGGFFGMNMNSELLSYNESMTINPKLTKPTKHFEFKVGDLLLVRGFGFNSAMTARLTDEEQYFSHVAIVGIDKSGRLQVYEALRNGLIATPIEDFVKLDEARVSVLRNKDENLAFKTGQWAHEIFQLGKGRPTGTIPYDFRFDETDRSTLFCSEFVQYVYERATDGAATVPAVANTSTGVIKLPRYRSSAKELKQSGFLDRIGMSSAEFFAPSDIELNSEFELVADWRNPRKTRNARLEDAVIISILDMITQKGYEPQGNVMELITKGILKLRNFPYISSQVPKNIPEKGMSTYLNVLGAATILYGKIDKIESALRATGQVSLIAKNSVALAEKFRELDCHMYEKYGISEFHFYFRNAKKSCSQVVDEPKQRFYRQFEERLPLIGKKLLQTQFSEVSSEFPTFPWNAEKYKAD